MRRSKIVSAFLIMLTLVLILLCGCGLERFMAIPETTVPTETEAQTEPAETGKKTTLMVYMVGSTLESEYGAASMDIKEMLKSGIDFTKNNVIVYTGGSSSWELGFPTDVNSVMQLSGRAPYITEVAGTKEPVNMGDADTFADFLNYAYRNYPADQYALICWNHGSGPVFGFGNDELFDYDSLTLEEMQLALEMSPFNRENKLAWVGFDACLMASVEVAAVFDDYADYLIASQETEPGCGWDYSFLSAMNEEWMPETISHSIIDAYAKSIEDNRSKMYNPAYTLSCMDLSKLRDVTSAMDLLFAQMARDLENGGYANFVRLRDSAKRFGLSAVSSRGESLDLVDLENIADSMVDTYPTEAGMLRDAIDSMIVYEISNIESACGVSVYYPYDNELYYLFGAQDIYDSIAPSREYQSYLQKFTDLWFGNEEPASGERFLTSQTPDAYSLALSEEQLANFSSAYYTILWETEEGLYTPIVMDCKIEPDENGTITVPLNQQIVMGVGAVENETIWPVTEISRDSEKIMYNTLGTSLLQLDTMSAPEMFQDIHLQFSADGSGEIQIKQLEASDDENLVMGKESLSIDHWKSICYDVYRYIPGFDSDGKLLPYSEWETDGTYGLNYIQINGTFGLYCQDLSELEGNFCGQIIVRDTTGNEQGSELFLLNSQHAQTYSEQTEQGQITYHMYDDHASVASYTGTDSQLVLPNSINGLPITQIEGRAFQNAKFNHITLPASLTEIQNNAFFNVPLWEINFPEGLKKIGDEAFWGHEMSEVILPSSLTHLGAQSFGGCGSGYHLYEYFNEEYKWSFQKAVLPRSLQYIGDNPFLGATELSELCMDTENAYYYTADNVLYTKDGKTLICAAMTNRNEFTIPTGVEVIGAYAFADAMWLQKVVFPDTLKEIGIYAFLNCSLEELQLPTSLETIGFCAFRNDYERSLASEDVPQQSLSKVYIPENVTWIGENAFAGTPVALFEVSENNPCYSAQGGFLLNKAGDKLYICGSGLYGSVSVPEGIRVIVRNAFCDREFAHGEERQYITELHLPDSLLMLKQDPMFGLHHLEKMEIGSRLKNWKPYMDIIDGHSEKETIIIISKDNPYFAVEDGVVVKKS